jgi:hypothetical protein
MLKISIVAVLFFSTLFSLKAQDNSIKHSIPKTTTYKKMDYFHFEAAWLGWLDTPDSIKIKALSHTVTTYLSYPMQIGKSKFSFTPGIGVSIDNIYLNATPKLDTASKLYLSPIPTSTSYKLNKQTYGYIVAPLTLSYNSKADKYGKMWKISAGLRFNMLINSHTKYKGNNAAGVSEKIKTFNIPNTNKYRVDAALTIGYDWIYIMANYSLSNYVTTGKGTQYHPFNIGVGIVGF